MSEVNLLMLGLSAALLWGSNQSTDSPYNMLFVLLACACAYMIFVQNRAPMVKDWKKVLHFEGVSLDQLKGLVEEKSKDALVVVDFYATWCPPCKVLAPRLADWSEEHPEVVFIGVNAESSPEARSHYKVSCYPTLVFIKGDEVVDKVEGADSTKILRLINQNKGK